MPAELCWGSWFYEVHPVASQATARVLRSVNSCHSADVSQDTPTQPVPAPQASGLKQFVHRCQQFLVLRLLFGTSYTSPKPTSTPRLRAEKRNYAGMGVLLTLLLGCLLALNEINALASGFVAGGGAAMDFGALSGLRFPSVREFWAEPMAADDLEAWNWLLRTFLVVDFGFVVVYALLLWAVVKAEFVLKKWRRFLQKLVLGLVVADLLENAFMWFSGGRRVSAGADGGYEPLHLLAFFTSAKWALLGLIVGLVLVSLIVRDRGSVVSPWRSALWVQRYSLLAFLPVAALACLPFPKVGDQVPDIERRWLEGGAETWHLVFAVLATLLAVAPAIFFLGRLRADCAFKRSHDQRPDGRGWPWYHATGKPREAHLWHWLIAPVLALVLYGVAWAAGWPVDGRRLTTFSFITVGVPFASMFVRWRFQKKNIRRAARVELASTSPEHVMKVGDALAIAAVAAVGLGMVRAWIGLLAVGISTEDVDVPWQLWLAMPLAVLAAVMPWLLANTVLARLNVPDELTGTESKLAVQATPVAPLVRGRVTGESSLRLRATLLGVAGVVIGWMAFQPIWWAETFGVIASVTLGLGAAMVLLGVTVAYAQESRPPEILLVVPRPWLSTTPIVPIILIGLIATTQAGDATHVHGIDQEQQEYQAVPARPLLTDAFTAWTDVTDPCVLPDAITVDISGASRTLDARPMLILAAEGGGIRATYWTAQGLEEVADAAGACGNRMTLFSAGASGGSLGLVIGRYDGEPVEAVEAIRGPESLGAGAVALVTGDLIASTTGVRLGAPAADTAPDGSDRAATMQQVWAEAWADADTGDGPADHRFIEADDGSALGAVTGHLVLTSTDAYDGCRALWSQLDLSPPSLGPAASLAEGSNAPGCGNGGAGPNSYDIFSAFGAVEGTTRTDEHCLGNVSALTAGLASGRFPYVTPSAVVGPCAGLKETPLVDGGIADNTGLGTIVDLAQQWGPPVRAYNDEVLASGTGALILPMIVYLDNGSATSFGIGQRGGSIAESLVPLWAIGAAKTRQTQTSALLKQSADAAERFLCSEPSVEDPEADPTPCEQLLEQQAGERQLFVVHQATQPTLSAPLGWVLSDASVSDLQNDMEDARENGCALDPVCIAGHGTLLDLRERLGAFRER